MNKFMEAAIIVAQKAAKKSEIPVGAVIVKNGKIISQGYNKRQIKQISTKHAEIVAIEKACKKLHSWRLDECEMYVTLEPCPMCAGAIANARIKKVYYAAEETTGGDGLMQAIFSSKRLNHKVEIEKLDDGGVSAQILKDFFKKRRSLIK